MIKRHRFISWLLGVNLVELQSDIAAVTIEMSNLRMAIRATRDDIKNHAQLAIDYQQLSLKQRPLLDAVRTFENCGITRKYGGNIDIAYDRFLNGLGPHGEAELLEIIEERQARSAKKLQDEAEGLPPIMPWRK